jgi:hypothetical protein
MPKLQEEDSTAIPDRPRNYPPCGDLFRRVDSRRLWIALSLLRDLRRLGDDQTAFSRPRRAIGGGQGEWTKSVRPARIRVSGGITTRLRL